MKCHSCSFERENDFIFCPQCGTKISDIIKGLIKDEIQEALKEDTPPPAIPQENSHQGSIDVKDKPYDDDEITYETTDPRKLEYKKLFKQVLGDRKITPDEVLKLEDETKRLGLDKAEEEILQREVARELGINYKQVSELCVSSVNLMINANKFYTVGQMDNLHMLIENISSDPIENVSITATFSNLTEKKQKSISKLRPLEKKEVQMSFRHTQSGNELVELKVEYFDVKGNPYIYKGEFDIKIFKDEKITEGSSTTIGNISINLDHGAAADFQEFLKMTDNIKQGENIERKPSMSSIVCDGDKRWNMLFILLDEQATIQKRNEILITKKIKEGERKLIEANNLKAEAEGLLAKDKETAKGIFEKAYNEFKNAEECFNKVMEIDPENTLSYDRIKGVRVTTGILETTIKQLDIKIKEPVLPKIKLTAACLTLQQEQKKYFLYSKDKITLGKSRENDVVLRLLPLTPKEEYRENLAKTNQISGTHACILIRSGGFYIKDIGSENKGSTNGTYLDGKRIEPLKEYPLKNGMRVNIARVLDIECEFYGDLKKLETTSGLTTSCETVMGDISDSCFGIDKKGAINLIRLRRRNNASSVEEYIILIRELTIGSSRGNEIVLNGDKVQDRHARVFYKNNQYWIEDLNSRYGTWVNGKEIKPGIGIPLGEKSGIVIGDIAFSSMGLL
jgi:pSer/pThr/pTyr-binding forkhead associated (FHA) protein